MRPWPARARAPQAGQGLAIHGGRALRRALAQRHPRQHVERGERHESLADFAGLGARSPWLAAAMAVFMFSLAGFPPTGGFLAKLFVFRAAVAAGHAELAVIGVLCSLVSVYYYLRVVYYMYMRGGVTEAPRPFTPPAWVVTLAISVAGSVLLGIFAGPMIELAQRSPLAGG